MIIIIIIIIIFKNYTCLYIFQTIPSTKMYASHQFARSSRNGLLPIAQLWTRIPTPLWYLFYTRQTTGD